MRWSTMWSQDTEICRNFTFDPTESDANPLCILRRTKNRDRHRTVPWRANCCLEAIYGLGRRDSPAGQKPAPSIFFLHVRSGENASWPQANQRRSNQVFYWIHQLCALLLSLERQDVCLQGSAAHLTMLVLHPIYDIPLTLTPYSVSP